MRIGKVLFGADEFFFGLELSLKKAGREAQNVTPQMAFVVDVLLVSLFWFRDIYLFEAFLRESGLKSRKSKPIIIIGGIQATITPELCAELADYVFIGDADDYLGSILDDIENGKEPESPYLYRKGQKVIPKPAECLPSAFAIKKREGKRATTRIEIARGCKFKCKFCVLSHLKPYREVPASDIIDLLKTIDRKGPFSLFAPERTVHSEWDKIQRAIKRFKINDYGADARLEHIHKVEKNKVTFGLEGISYKLRKSIGKSFSDNFILEKMSDFTRKCNRVAMFTIFFIADLPGEAEEDWRELWELFRKIESEEWSRKITVIPVLNPLSPKPFTDLENAEIHPFRDYETKWINFLRKNDEHWGFRVLETMIWGPWHRVLDSIVHRGGREAYQVVARLPKKYLKQIPAKKDRMRLARQLVKECKQFGITEEQLFYPRRKAVG